MGMGTLCSGKKAPIYGHGDTLHWFQDHLYYCSGVSPHNVRTHKGGAGEIPGGSLFAPCGAQKFSRGILGKCVCGIEEAWL